MHIDVHTSKINTHIHTSIRTYIHNTDTIHTQYIYNKYTIQHTITYKHNIYINKYIYNTYIHNTHIHNTHMLTIHLHTMLSQYTQHTQLNKCSHTHLLTFTYYPIYIFIHT